MFPKRLVVGVGTVVLVLGSLFGIACDDDDDDDDNGNGGTPVATDTLDDTGDDTGDDDTSGDPTPE